ADRQRQGRGGPAARIRGVGPERVRQARVSPQHWPETSRSRLSPVFDARNNRNLSQPSNECFRRRGAAWAGRDHLSRYLSCRRVVLDQRALIGLAVLTELR